MKRLLFSAAFLLLIASLPMKAQRDTLRRVFLNAESWMLYEEYKEALPLYRKLLSADPGNSNLKYKIGICLLNDPYQKDKAINYLREASQNINPDCKENSFKERTAPPDVLYYLGDAYLVNQLLDQAVASYESFLKIMDEAIYDEELVLDQIEACKHAQELIGKPVDLDLFLLDTLINSRYAELNPVVSGDGQTMAFIKELPFYDGAFITRKQADGWSYPQAITSALGFDEGVYPVALSHDGTEMILYYNDEYIGNLYYSRLKEGIWQKARKMGENISTKYWESNACFSPDGKYIYFTSNRKGGYGGLDIYRSKRLDGDKWGSPENLGPTINTQYNEETPAITEDGTLYFSSYGHSNMGGYDVFRSSQNEDGSWTTPVNMGYPINTTDDDMSFAPISNGKGAYYSVYSSKGLGRHDIYYMDIYSEDNPRMYAVSGNLSARDRDGTSADAWVNVLEADDGDTLLRLPADPKSGDFIFSVKKGDYALHMAAEGFETLVVPLEVGSPEDKNGISLGGNITLTPLEAGEEHLVLEGDESIIRLRENSYVAKAGESIKVPVRVEKGSELLIRTYKDGVLIDTDTILARKRRINLDLEVHPGEQLIEIETRDKAGNIHRNTLKLKGETISEESRRDKAETARDKEASDAGSSAGKEDPRKAIADNSDPSTEIQADRNKEAVETAGVNRSDGTEILQPEEVLSRHPGEELTTKLMLMDLRDEARGKLKQALDELDLEKEGIHSGRALFEHLYQHAEEKGYSTREVTDLLAGVISGGNLEAFIEALIKHSDGALHDYLLELDTKALGIDSPKALLLHLQELGDSKGFNMEQVWDAMIEALYKPGMPASAVPAALTLIDLRQSADGPLLEALKDLDPTSGDLLSSRALFEKLYELAGEYGYTEEDVDRLLAAQLGMDASAGREALLAALEKEEIRTLAELAGGGDPALLFRKLLEQADGALSDFLTEKGEDLEKLGSIAELVRLLELEAAKGRFDMQDVRDTLVRAMENRLAVEDLFAHLLEVAEPPLSKALEKIALRRDRIYGPEALITRIYEILLKMGLSDEEARNLLSEYMPGHKAFIDTLGQIEFATGLLLAAAGIGLLILIILLVRRRKKE
ncbi:MAG: hypothetical protein CSA96_07260 [Bacteroidetes bacterium]|nr:MAG: hypothetical protein CSA96_07260 [Bacteroidota bacterium]